MVFHFRSDSLILNEDLDDSDAGSLSSDIPHISLINASELDDDPTMILSNFSDEDLCEMEDVQTVSTTSTDRDQMLSFPM